MSKDFFCNLPLYVGFPFKAVYKIFMKIYSYFVAFSAALHKQFDTETGKKLAQFEAEMEKVMKYAEHMKQAEKAASSAPVKKRQKATGSRLADIIKGDSNVPPSGSIH